MKRYFLILIISALLIAALAGCQEQVFDGSKTGNDKQFILDYSVLNRTMTHEMELKQGMVIDVNIENRSGRVDILITDANGESIYRGDNASSCSFSIEAQEAGTYHFTVTGSNAKGGIRFVVKE